MNYSYLEIEINGNLINDQFYQLIKYNTYRIKKDPSAVDAKSPKKLMRPSPMKRQTKMSSTPKSTSSSSQPATPATTPVKQEREPDKLSQLTSPDRKIGQKIGMRLRNLLKLPKAHKWVCYEWFYSNIDKYV